MGDLYSVRAELKAEIATLNREIEILKTMKVLEERIEKLEAFSNAISTPETPAFTAE